MSEGPSLIGMFFLRPEDLPEGFYTPFISSVTRSWAYVEGITMGIGWTLVITHPFPGWLAIGSALLIASVFCDRRERRWAKRLREEIR